MTNWLIMSFIMRKSLDHVNHMVAPTASDEVFEAIHTVMHLYRSAQYRGVRAGESELTHMEGKVLGFFERHPGATQKELSLHSGRDKGQLARLIGALKERGLLDAEPDPDDRRNVRLQLTKAGRRMQETVQRHARQLSEQAVEGMSAEERATLVALLARVRENLTAED